jgi:hypothetical protein
MSDDSATVSENLISFGPSHFLRAVVIPLANDIEGIAKDHPVRGDDAVWSPGLSGKPQAGMTLLAGFVGVVAFVGSWAAKKALDELYIHKLSPLIRTALSAYLQSSTTGKKYAVSLLVNNSAARISILIAAVGSSIEEIEISETLIGPVLSGAVRRASQSAGPNQVHLYTIENGYANVDPFVFSDISGAMSYLSGMSAAKHPRLLANDS